MKVYESSLHDWWLSEEVTEKTISDWEKKNPERVVYVATGRESWRACAKIGDIYRDISDCFSIEPFRNIIASKEAFFKQSSHPDVPSEVKVDTIYLIYDPCGSYAGAYMITDKGNYIYGECEYYPKNAIIQGYGPYHNHEEQSFLVPEEAFYNLLEGMPFDGTLDPMGSYVDFTPYLLDTQE